MNDPIKLFYTSAIVNTVIGASYAVSPALPPLLAPVAAFSIFAVGRRVAPSLRGREAIMAATAGILAGTAMGGAVAYGAHVLIDDQQSVTQNNAPSRPVKIDYSGPQPVAIIQSKKATLG